MSNTAPAAPAASEPVNTTSQVAGAPVSTQAPPSGPAPSASSVEQTPPGAAPETVVEVPAWKAKAEAQGFVDVNTPEELAERSLAALELRIKSESDLRAQLQDLTPMAALARQFIAQGMTPAQAQATAQQTVQQEQIAAWNPVPEFNDAEAARYREKHVGADGKETIGWKANTPANVIADYERALVAREQWADQIVSNPAKAFAPLIEQITRQAKEAALKDFQETLAKQEREQAQAQFYSRVQQEHGSWLYVQDPTTKKPLTDGTGNFVLSPSGIQANHLLDIYVKAGLDHNQAWNAALAIVENERLKSQHSTASANQINEQKKAELLRAQSTASSGGSRANPAGQNPSLSFREKFTMQLRRDGVTSPTA
jgi:hypothetical protein